MCMAFSDTYESWPHSFRQRACTTCNAHGYGIAYEWALNRTSSSSAWCRIRAEGLMDSFHPPCQAARLMRVVVVQFYSGTNRERLLFRYFNQVGQGRELAECEVAP